MMISIPRSRGVWLTLVLAFLAATSPRPPLDAQTALRSGVEGQSVTRLPDGRELLLGGTFGGRAQGGGWLRDPRSGALVPIRGLAEPRAWHAATLLPDGTVLVIGGMNDQGRAVQGLERFDPSTGAFSFMPTLTWRARGAHTATLVDSQHIVIAGGVVDGEAVGDVDLLDLDAWQTTGIGTMGIARAYHSARLLPDGRIALWGGRGSDPNADSSGAIVDSTLADVLDIFAPEPEDPSLWLAASDPADGALVDVPATVMLRLSRPARADTLTPNTVTLASVSGGVEVRIVSAEQGRLIFVTPTAPLQSNTAYLVTVTGARDTANAPFPLLSVSFTTKDTSSAAGPLSSDAGVWDPRADPSGLAWHRTPPESRWRNLPPLLAPPGVTAVSGQALRLDGSPLAGVTMEIDGHPAVTDSTGRFLLVHQRLGTGWHELGMDGRRTRSGANHGTYEVAVWVTAGRTAVLPYTIWLPKIDAAHAVPIASPTTGETVITTPLIPGLELRLPAGTVITDEDGQIVRTVSLTPIPVSQPPFPLAAGVDVPIYFTIQPGGAYVRVAGSGGYARGARLVYPNLAGRPPGAPVEFWHYEPEGGRGWYVYGRGAVTADGRQMAPNPGVSIHEFTSAMAADPALGGGPSDPPGNDGASGGEPVQLGTGVFTLDKTDLALPDVLPIGITRTYRTLDTVVRSFGLGATHQFDVFLVGTVFPYTYLDLVLPNGSRVHFPRTSAGTGYLDAEYEHTASPTKYFKSRIEIDGNEWRLDLKDGSSMWFRDGFQATRPAQGAVTRIRDRYGNTIVLTRNTDADLTRITSPNGRWIELTYDTSHRVTQAADNGGRTVGYTYDGSGRLWKVTDPASGVTEYTYDASHRLLTIKDARGIVFLTNHYDGNGRVDLQTQADSTTFQFAYTLDAQGRVEQTDLTDPRGFVRRATFDPATGYLLSDTAAVGTPLARTTTLTRNGNNLVTRVTDGLGRNTDSTYDTSGNVTSVTRLAGTGNAVTTNYTYDATFNLLTSVTDPLTHATTFTRDSLGNVTSITDPLQHQTTFTYNATGQPLTVTTPAGTMQFGYDGGDLVSVTDPLGRTTTRFIDSMGRLVRTTNPLGQATTHTYDALNAVTQTLDALGGTTGFTYDANRNLLTLTDALTHATTYTYNNMDRVQTRTDPLTRGETYVYDANGNLQQVTDRKSQVTGYTYDALDRLSTVTYQGGSTTTYTYDAGDRVTQVVDSLAGTITRTWDGLDRLTNETTPEGSITYTYDAADRRATMTVAGQPQVTYGYDNANRLTSITQSSSTVGFTYDEANRRTVLTLPNGVTVEYGYDTASQVTGLTYKLGAATLGNLTYTYDLSGNRTSVGGTWARTGLPTALASATYDAANQIATWGGTAFTYDANGNLTNDGAKTYTWNTRNQLSALSGGVSASFQYDGLGRRRAKNISGASTGFLYDGLNTVQELVSGSPSANILAGLGIDEWLTRTDGAGARHFLTDVLGSTLALADGAGAVQTEYTYEPFGKTTVSGESTGNGFQFTGRENDGTGLYAYRARFHNPALQRFASEDPLEFAAGDVDLYAYVRNRPTTWRDPTGLQIILFPPGHPCHIPREPDKQSKSDDQPPQKPPLSWYLRCSPVVVPDLVPVPIIRPGHTGRPRVRFHVDPPGTHTFPWGGQPAHVQIEIYWDGVPGSGITIPRIPIPWPWK